VAAQLTPAMRSEISEPATKRTKTESVDSCPAPKLESVAPGTLSLDDVSAWVNRRWEEIVEMSDHPLQYLRQQLRSKESKKEFCRAAVRGMLEAHPDMRKTCRSIVALHDATQENIGCSGEGHILMPGFDRMQGVNLPVFWKGNPSIERIWDVMERALRSGSGLDTTSKTLKLAVAKDLCDKDMSKQMLFAGYVSGSTLGAGGLLLLFLLLEFPAAGGDVWSVPAVNKFLLSLARLKCNFVVYADASARSMDAWSALCFMNDIFINALSGERAGGRRQESDDDNDIVHPALLRRNDVEIATLNRKQESEKCDIKP